jgi:uncharacterized membrane protein YgcG
MQRAQLGFTHPRQLEQDLIRRREQLQRDREENRISPRYWESISRYFDKSIERQRRLRESTGGESGSGTDSGAGGSGSGADSSGGGSSGG